MGKAKFVFNRKAFSDQVLKSRGIQQVTHDACVKAVGSNPRGRIKVRDQTQGRTRNGVTVITDAKNESVNGALTQTLGRIRI
ncbi:hypothetical protein BACT_0492 [Bifidobacterium actinocoloniiforme DSM 22766]|uniref:Uncharacterized protein n=1 Tax=Bifidobacterium actinocoloniiforme DSM 22766 TaxID=1437605 RepID=A0A086YZU2_9BIFI|nr:hypothetical protein [Bifidobacterium actinocoloniiforme]AKV55080.1 hypothetical protein AB656_01080 [Bifidobacterium actinocoloniiforme DSM 22766]KFI39792.1 hypothetical protein BACT_0492 [Bifidobacterium actinocoloniiforme DSM 22766]